MTFLVVVGSLAAALFIVSYSRANRFSLTILSLGAGYILAEIWVDALASYQGINVPVLSWRDTVYSLLILIPALLALLFSHKKESLLPRIVQASVVGVFVVVLLLPVLDAVGRGSEAYAFLERYRALIVTAALLLGILDMVVSRSRRPSKHAKH